GDVTMLAGTSIVDNDAIGTVNVQATNLRMVATAGLIGNAGNTTSDTNDLALDLEVDTVAASADDGIYLHETTTGAALEIGTVAAIDVTQVHFDSGTTTVSDTAALSGLTTATDGPIKVVASDGTLTVSNAVSAHGTGDVLLDAQGTDHDVVIDAAVTSGSGNVTITAADDVDQDANVSTVGGDILITAGGDIDMDASVPTSTSSGDGNIRLVATAGNIGLSLVNAGSGDVTMLAGTSIVDNDAIGTVNVQATNLRMVATAGLIGNAGNTTSDT
ncbi:MAG: hypothetical protein GY715_14895, partial [Planctomycetes bacterium]|nr:hypothetical protein [Planctomycetota bacterium]